MTLAAEHLDEHPYGDRSTPLLVERLRRDEQDSHARSTRAKAIPRPQSCRQKVTLALTLLVRQWSPFSGLGAFLDGSHAERPQTVADEVPEEHHRGRAYLSKEIVHACPDHQVHDGRVDEESRHGQQCKLGC